MDNCATPSRLFHLLPSITLLSIAGLFPVTAWSEPATSNELYTRHCAACHGTTGSGGIGPPLNLPDLHAAIDDDYLVKTIRYGRPGRVMPAFKQLTADEVTSLVQHVRGFSKPAIAFTVKSPKGNAARGKPLYTKHCASCHGANGEGGHGTGVTFSRPRTMPVLAPALNNSGFLAAASDSVIKKSIMRGRRGTPMPSFTKRGLRERDIDDIVAFVRNYSMQPVVTAAAVDESEPAILQRTSRYTLTETVERIQDVMSRYNLRLVRTAAYTPATPGQPDEQAQQLIIDGCDFGFLNQALSIDPRVGLFLPCRINVMQLQNTVLVMTVNPKRMSPIFNNTQLDGLCDEMYKLYNNLLDEAIE